MEPISKEILEFALWPFPDSFFIIPHKALVWFFDLIIIRSFSLFQTSDINFL
jgi:hypothetical protein